MYWYKQNEENYNFHPALINVTALQHYHNESVCVCAWIIYTCIGIC